MRRVVDDRTHSAARWELAWPDPRLLATATGAVFAGLGRITQQVGQDGTSTYAYLCPCQLPDTEFRFLFSHRTASWERAQRALNAAGRLLRVRMMR